MKLDRFGIVAGLALWTASEAHSLDANFYLDNVQGTVHVQTEVGVQQVFGGEPLGSHQQIIVKQNSTAILRNDAGPCYFSVREAGVYQVPKAENCVAGQVSVLQGDITIVPANGQSMAYGASGSEVSPVLVGGGFVAAVAGTVVYNFVDEAEDHAVSAH